MKSLRVAPAVLFATVFATVACSSSPEPIERLAPPTDGEGFQLAMDTTAPPGSEIWKCAVYPIPIEEGLAPVNSVRYQQNSGMHHMTLSTTGIGGKKIDYGIYDCEDLGDLMDEVIMIFGSQGAAEDTIQLPEGVAATLVPNLDIIHEVHYVNTSEAPVDVFSRVNAYTIPSEEVVEGIWGGQVRDEHIEIPADSEHTEWTRCVMNEDVDVLFLASHTHQLGIEFTIAPFDGTTVGDVFYSNDDWHDPKIVQYDPPLVLKAGEGFEYSCTWRNDTDAMVPYGLKSTEEMCNLAIVHTPYSESARCEVVETSDGVIWSPDE
ncbi:MAG: hypothetical protein RIT81_44620 [Deltaproteobacteria bacterium]